MMTSCFSCGSNENKVLACTGCRTVFYCDTQCQTKDWQARHQNDCHLLKEMCEIAARIPVPGSHELIGKPVKRGASTSPSSEDKRETKKANAVPVSPSSSPSGRGGSSVADRSSEATAVAPAPSARRERETDLRKVVYPLPKDLFRLIALMVKLDAPALMRSSPAWAIFYEQIEWKNILLSRWDAPSDNMEAARKGAAPMGQWLDLNNIFSLYSNLLVERSLYILTAEQQEEVTAINREKRERFDAIAIGLDRDPDDPFVMDGVPESAFSDLVVREDLVERSILLSRIQGIPFNQDTQRSLINIFMLYYMYEENVALVPEGHFLGGGGGNSGIGMDGFWQTQNGKTVELTNGDSDLEESAFFPVEVLTGTLTGKKLAILYDGWSGNDPESILDIARYSAFIDTIGPDVARRFGNFRLNIELARIKNLPGGLTQCYSIVRSLVFRGCGSFSERSFANLAKLTRLEKVFVLACDWETASVDFYGTCPLLKEVKIRSQEPSLLRRIRVSPSVLRESKTPGVFGACFPPTLSDRSSKFPEFGFGLETGMDETTRARILPPGPFGGLARVDHVRRILKSAFLSGDWIEDREERESKRMFARLEAGLIKEGLLSLVENDPMLDKEGDDVTNSFIKVLEATGISPIPAAQNLDDDGNVALPFRIWFHKGLDFGDKAQSKGAPTFFVSSFAVRACNLSAVRRRGPKAKISLEEMAEALVAWMVSVRNLALFKRNGDEPRRKYCQFIQANSDDRVDRLTEDDPYSLTWTVEHPTIFLSAKIAHLSIPHEIVMSLLNQMTTRSEIADLYCVCNFKRFLGPLPAWMWLLPKRTETILVERARYFSLPPQLMYHPGLSTLSVRDSSSWGTPDGEPQWDIFHLAPEARPGPADAKDGTFMHQYFHDFARLELRMTDAPWTCFPPMDLSTYDCSMFLEFKQQLN